MNNKNQSLTHRQHTGLYSLDVEADGPCPGLYSMLSFGLVPLDAPERGFYTTLAPISERYKEGALKTNKWTREETLGFTPPAEAMAQFAEWLAKEPVTGRKIIWSDNPAFDWQFFNYYCHAYLGDNPFGHSARRIADFAAGLEGGARATRDWKRLRTEAHTHNALEDARGNAGALRKLLAPRQAPKASPVPAMPLATVAAYSVPLVPNDLTEITIKPMRQRDGSILWAVLTQFGMCLNKNDELEQEPSSSNRSAAFFRRCRWTTAESAYQAWERWAAAQTAQHSARSAQ